MDTFRLPADELEFAVLSELWRLGSAPVRELHSSLGVPKGLAYTTTAKVLDRLRAKGLIERARRGNLFWYQPRIAREAVERARTRQIIGRLLGSAPRGGVAALVEAVESFDEDLLAELERAVAARRRAGHAA